MRALVTNDDGIESEGLRCLAKAALDCNCEVVVAAPKQDSSGSSASLAGFASDGRIVVERRDVEGMPDVTAFAVSAAPSLITLVATYGAFGPRPDVVLSGINIGPNLGTAILHSGTVGAAMTGRVQGCRAMSVSLADTRGVAHWETAASVVRRVLQWLSDLDDEVVLNVNVPNVAPADLRGLRYGEIKGFGSVQAMMIERGEGWVRTRIADPPETRVDPDSDAAQVEHGFASVTALRPLCTAHPPDVSLLLAADAPLP